MPRPPRVAVTVLIRHYDGVEWWPELLTPVPGGQRCAAFVYRWRDLSLLTSMYSQNDKAILMRWQVAKVRSDWRVLAHPGMRDDVAPEDKVIQAEYYAARDALKHFEDRELIALAEQAHPPVPNVNLNTSEGYRRWCQVQQNIMEAELKLLAISREIEDAFPHLKMRA
jgi:hypothetical protein